MRILSSNGARGTSGSEFENDVSKQQQLEILIGQG